MNFLEQARAENQLNYWQSESPVQGELSDGSKFWDVPAEKFERSKPREAAPFEQSYYDRLKVEYDSLTERTQADFNRFPTQAETSKLRDILGPIYKDGVEMRADGLNQALKHDKPTALKFNLSKAEQKKLDAQTPGIYSQNRTLRSQQMRVTQGRGLDPEGNFIVGEVIRQERRNVEIDKLKLARQFGSLTEAQFDEGMEKIFMQDNRSRSGATEKLIYDPANWEAFGTPKGPDGTPRSISGFLEQLGKDWTAAGDTTKYFQDETGFKMNIGHIFAAKKEGEIMFRGGSDAKWNTAYQVELADPNAKFDDSKWVFRKIGSYHDRFTQERIENWANLPLSNRIPNDAKDLEQVFRGRNIVEAYSEWLMEPDVKQIDWYKRLNEKNWHRAAFDPNIGAEEGAFRGERIQDIDTQIAEEEIKSFKAPRDPKDNPTIPSENALANVDKIKSKKARARGLMKLVKNTFSDENTSLKVFRNGARIAGQANNPLVNIAGDVLGAGIDGAMLIADPNLENSIDFALSAGQVALTGAGLIVAALPIPGARPGAFAIMKLGDLSGTAGAAKKVKDTIDIANNTLATVERLWNMQREGFDLARPGAGRLRLGDKGGVELRAGYKNSNMKPTTEPPRTSSGQGFMGLFKGAPNKGSLSFTKPVK